MENSIKLPDFKLGKDYPTLESSMNISDLRATYIKSAIIFEAICNDIVMREFYDDEKDIPEELFQSPSILKKAFEHITDYNEQIYLLLMFQHGYLNISKMLEETAEKSDDEFLEDMEKSIEEAIKSAIGNIPAFSIRSIRGLVKKIGFDFQKFVDTIIDESNYDAKGARISPVTSFKDELTEEKMEEIKNKIDESLKKTLAKFLQKKQNGESGTKGGE